MRNQQTVRRLAVEALEERTLLAGNVLATFQAGDLLIRGDALDNQLQLVDLGGGLMRVQGSGTLVNGQAFFDTTGVVHDIEVKMQQGGTDQFTIQGAFHLTGDLAIRLGNGNVLIEGSDGPVSIGEDLRIRTGDESDVTVRNEVHVLGATALNSGGTLTVAAGRATLPNYADATFSDSLNIDNPYFPLVEGSVYTYEVVDDGEVVEMIVVEVLPDTRTIQGVEARVVRDRVWVDGLLIEDTFDWYAQDDTGNVWYLGETVTNYVYDDQGNLIGANPGGSWENGVNGAVPGVIMEANPRVGDRYYQEFNRNDVLDQAEVLARGLTTTVPAGTFHNVLRTKDVTVMAPDGLEHKFYAPGLGPIQELGYDHLTGENNEILRLVSVTLNGQEVTQVVDPKKPAGTNVGGRFVGGIRFDGPAKFSSGDSMAVLEAVFSSTASFVSEAELSVAHSLITGKATFAAEETLGLRAVTAQQGVQITGDEEVHITASQLGQVKVTLGAGNNLLAITSSILASLEADGGTGTDLFDNGGGNTIGKSKLKRFELG